MARKKRLPEKGGRRIRLLLVWASGLMTVYSLIHSFFVGLLTTLPFIAVGLAGVLLALRWEGFCASLIWLRGRRWGRILTIVAVSLIASAFLIVAIISGFMVGAAVRPAPQNATLILLGCQVRGETPSMMLTRRMEAALIWLEENQDAVGVLSGGQGPGEWITEAECMRRWLTARGIPEERLFMEERSTSTFENIRFSKEVIEANDLPRTVAIATDGFHQLRAQTFAEREGLETGAVLARTPVSVLPFYWFREVVAIAIQVVLAAG
jgi:uncharacterized SAM-binding protein YcdF (DUF218 family)